MVVNNSNIRESIKMEETSRDIIVQHIENQRVFFSTNKTKGINFRLAQLRKLKKAIQKKSKET
tara:strand:- start:4071 stop:4259 length:189 start_codon:yes stop_codon:yes gene_type:complete